MKSTLKRLFTRKKTETTILEAGKQSTANESLSDKVTFEYFAPEAGRVNVAGTFNNWSSQETSLKRDQTGRWKVELDLQPGDYEYRFLVDGKWLNDQKPVGIVRNPFGSSNNAIKVPSAD